MSIESRIKSSHAARRAIWFKAGVGPRNDNAPVTKKVIVAFTNRDAGLPSAQLTPAEVVERDALMLERYMEGATTEDLQDEFGIGARYVTDIKIANSWPERKRVRGGWSFAA